jgi:hypothetical protein
MGQEVLSSATVTTPGNSTHMMVESPEEFDGFQILATAVLVGDPLAFLAGIVEVEHGGHSVYAQAVHMVAVAPT